MVVMLVAVVIYNVIILHTHSWLLDEFSKALYPAEAPDRYQHNNGGCWVELRSRLRGGRSLCDRRRRGGGRLSGAARRRRTFESWIHSTPLTDSKCGKKKNPIM